MNATSAFYTIRLKQRLPKHLCMAMQRTRHVGDDIRSLPQLSTHSRLPATKIVQQRYRRALACLSTTLSDMSWYPLMTPSPFHSFLFLSQCCSLFSHSPFAAAISSFPVPLPYAQGFPSLPPMALLVGSWAQGPLLVPLALLSQLGFYRYSHSKCDPLPNAVGGT